MATLDVFTALERVGSWLGRQSAVSPASFAIAESLRNLCCIDGIEVLPHDSDQTTFFAVFRNTGIEGEWLWTLSFGPGRAGLTLRSSTSQPAGRMFLTNLLCEAYTITDADELLRWWDATSEGRPRTVSSNLPLELDTLSEIIGQLERATIEASQSHGAGGVR